MSNKFNVFYIISSFVFVGLYLWSFVENLGGDKSMPSLAIKAYLILFFTVIGVNIFKMSKTVTSSTSSLLLRITSYAIFILMIYILLVPRIIDFLYY